MLTISQIRDKVAKIGQRYGIKSAYLFGSYAKNLANDQSDIDIVIDKGNIHSFKDFYHFRTDLEAELGTNVDILTEASLRPGLRDLIKNDRILLYTA